MNRLLVSCALGATVALSVGTAAQAAPTASAPLRCGDTTVLVTGFGRGQVLHVVGRPQNFVVTRAETGGEVVFDNPGQAGRADVVSCTTTSPTGRTFSVEGFFTPRR